MEQNYTRRYRKYASRIAHINRVPNTERAGRLQTFTFRDRLFTRCSTKQCSYQKNNSGICWKRKCARRA